MEAIMGAQEYVFPMVQKWSENGVLKAEGKNGCIGSSPLMEFIPEPINIESGMIRGINFSPYAVLGYPDTGWHGWWKIQLNRACP